MANARQLNDLLIHISDELELNDLITLNELNDRFEKEIAEIGLKTCELSEKLHQMILDGGKEPREIPDRRMGNLRRINEAKAS